MRRVHTLPVLIQFTPEMTSVLYSAGLNYQTGNPIRAEFNRVNSIVSDLRKVVEGQATEITKLRDQVAKLEAVHAPGGIHPPVPGSGGRHSGDVASS